MKNQNTSSKSWADTLRIYTQPATIRMFFLGFSAGLPLLLVLGTLSFWLREAGIDLKTIGFISWVGLVYGCKWLWAPLVDNLTLPYFSQRLGRRRAWLALSQLLIIAGILGMAFTDPSQSLRQMTCLALLTAFASATQDISLDAYRIESAETEAQGALAATYQTGYRLAMIWAGAGTFALAAIVSSTDKLSYDHSCWSFAYCVMALSMLVGLVTVLLSPEPKINTTKEERVNLLIQKDLAKKAIRNKFPKLSPISLTIIVWFSQTCLRPFSDFFYRYRWQAVAILALIATYRISDVVMGVMSNPFYRDLGFAKEEVAAISKIYGVAMTLFGAFLGGIVILRIGVFKTLFLGAFLSALTNLLFSWLATKGHDITFLIFTVSADNLASGLASAAFIAYLSGLTNKAYSATQYALFSSIMLILPKFIAGFSGVAVEAIGYSKFFIGTALIGLPVLALIPIVSWFDKNKGHTKQHQKG